MCLESVPQPSPTCLPGLLVGNGAPALRLNEVVDQPLLTGHRHLKCQLAYTDVRDLPRRCLASALSHEIPPREVWAEPYTRPPWITPSVRILLYSDK